MRFEASRSSGVRLAELMAALSVATDLGMGQPLEFALTATVLAMRLGEALGLSTGALRDVYYFGLLRYVGCNSETYAMAALFGDELAVRREFAAVDPGDFAQILTLAYRLILQAQEVGDPLHAADAAVAGVAATPGMMKEHFAGHCEVAQRLAERLGLGAGLIRALGQIYERWDGKGLPNGLKEEAVAPAVLLVTLAQDVVTTHRLAGDAASIRMVRERRRGAYDPRHADCFSERAPELLRGLDVEPAWDLVLGLEPGDHHQLTEAEFDNACLVLADFADVKSPYTLGHSPGVAELAQAAARQVGASESETRVLWRAGLLHDIGRVGVSAGIWTKPGPLTEREWEKVRLHPYFTERVLARPPQLAALGALAALHHERLDGSGYHRGLPASLLPPPARLLAAADVYHAMTEPRPHRPAHSAESAADELQRLVKLGRLDPDSVHGVLAAAGHARKPIRLERPAGLTGREVQVLNLIARGKSKKEMAQQLIVSVKTVDNHIQHIYEKIGVSTRAGATLFAVERDLLAASP